MRAASLFAPESEGFTATGNLNMARDSHTATVLPDGSVVVIGGTYHSCHVNPFTRVCVASAQVLSSAELFK